MLDHHEGTRERFTDLDATVADFVDEAESWAGDLLRLDEEHAPAEPERTETPPPRSLAVTIIAHYFCRLLVAVADLAGEDLAAAAAPQQPLRERPGWQRGRFVHPAYERYLGWCAAPALDLDAARSAVEAVDDEALRDQLRRLQSPRRSPRPR